MVVSIIGGSGSGKDTQAHMLAKTLSIPHLSMGAILREEERLKNPKALEAATYYNKGNWVPDEVSTAILKEYLQKHNYNEFVITGYPRFEQQCVSFDKLLLELNTDLTAVIHLEVPADELIRRMTKQREVKGEGAMTERADTSDEVIRQRLKSYQETIEPVLSHYRELGKLLNIDGRPSIEQVHADMLSKIQELV